MKTFLLSAPLFCLFCVPAFAQNEPQVEIFGGYQLIYDSGDDFEIDGFNYNGFTAAVEVDITPYFGIVGEFGYFRHTINAEESEAVLSGVPFLFGPRFSFRTEQVRVFGHYLLGGTRLNIDTTPDAAEWEGHDTFFTQAIGGGVDITVNDIVSIRLAQIDLMGTRFTEDSMAEWRHHFRYSGGIIFTFRSE